MSENPDVPPYVDLELSEDLNEMELRSRVIEDIQVSFPEWIPREGSVEVILAGALSLVVSEFAMAVNDIPEQLLERLLAMYQVYRSDGVKARATATFEVSVTAATHTIPKGTAMYIAVPETEDAIEFTTDEELNIITSESLVGTVGITAIEPGDTGRGIQVGTPMELTEVFSFVESVRLGSPITGGTNAETDEEYYTRGSTVFSRMSTTLVTPEHFRLAVLQNPDVGRAFVANLHDPENPTRTDSLGHITVAVADNDGNPLSSTRRQEIYAELILYSQAGLTVHVVDPTYTDVTIDIDIQVALGFNEDEVITRVEEHLSDWVSPKGWDWSGYLYATDIIVQVGSVPGVRRVVSVKAPNQSQKLNGVAALPKLTNVTVTAVP